MVHDVKIFKNDCSQLEPEDIVRKYLLDGPIYFFSQYDNHNEFDFKKDIASCLGAHLRDIAIVGSGKLGFSLKPDKDEPGLYEFKKFDFHEEFSSDLDIAVISNSIFDEQLRSLYKFTSSYKNQEVWKAKGDKKSLAFYILKGWIKPDFVPQNFLISNEFNDIRVRYKKEFGREINISIFKSWFFFESYHINNIKNIQLNLL